MMMAPLSIAPPGVPGMDVSGWQTNINWSQAWANGGRFAYVKATESNDYTSSQFVQQYSGSYAAGMIRGAYHFAIPNATSGATQANFFVNNGGGWSPDGRTLPPLLDIEYNPYTGTDHTDTCYGLSPSQMVSWIADFSSTVRVRTGITPAIYTTTGWWTQCTGNSASFAGNPLFIARYPNRLSDGPGSLPAGWSSHAMWQYADAGVFPGDQDVFNGSAASLQAIASGSSTPPVGPVAMAQPVVGVGDINGDGKPDLLARKPDGGLWFYAGTGASSSGAGYAGGIQVGSGWDVFNEIVGAGDVNGDGKNDLLARKPDGTLWLYASTGTTIPGFVGGVQIGTGWQIFTDIIAAGDVNGDGKPDLLGRKPDGTLWLYAGTAAAGPGNSGYAPGVQAGTGWNVFGQVIGVGDLNHDGHDDLVGMRGDGSLSYYRGTGTGYFPGIQISDPGISSTDLLIAAGDANGDGYPDLLTRPADGSLRFFAGSTAPQLAYLPGQQVGWGWNVFRAVIGAGDMNGDGNPDIVGVGDDGSLWSYAGNGSTGGINRGYQTGLKIGYGWGVFSKVINGGDFNGDGKQDLIGVRNDGSLWLYPGTGTVDATGGAYQPGILIGSGGWGVFAHILAGDFNADGRVDVLATGRDGSMWLYPGVKPTSTSAAWFGQPVGVSSGDWHAYDALASSRDSNGDGRADILARKPDGTLWFYAGSGAMNGSNSGLSSAALVGTAWNVFKTITSSGDTNSGRTGDLIAVKPDGTLWSYAGTGMAGIPGGGYAVAVVAGSGWNIFG